MDNIQILLFIDIKFTHTEVKINEEERIILMEQSNNCVVQTKNLGKSFGEVQALKSVNLNIPEHSIFGLLGPAGAGKTTFIKILLGLCCPTSGSGKIFGLDIVNNRVEICERVGYLPQRPGFIEYMSARENLLLTTRFFDLGSKKDTYERCDEMLELVGLENRAEIPMKYFARGEKQLLGIALAQINYPDLLILDEPVLSLDPVERQEVFEVIDRIRKDTTIIFSTHILDDVQRISDTVAILNHGTVEAYGSIEDLLNEKLSVEDLIIATDIQGQTGKRLSILDWVKQGHINQRNSNGTVIRKVII